MGVGAAGACLAPFDMHLHGDWFLDPPSCSASFAAAGGGALGCTVEPAGYEGLAAALGNGMDGPASEPGFLGLRPALGLHPWYLGEGAAAEKRLGRFCDLASGCRLVGEVGLDCGRAHRETFEGQLAAFERVCATVAPGSVLSIHSVASADAVLDVLGRTGRLDDCACVFHWFSGTSDELSRARAAGCFFSVGPFMLRSRRGREYARQVPVERLLWETDLPERLGILWDAEAEFSALGEALGCVASLKSMDVDELAAAVAATSRVLLAR
ncbi:TatD family hydrolase [Atopobiaceae bacterium 24-176]